MDYKKSLSLLNLKNLFLFFRVQKTLYFKKSHKILNKVDQIKSKEKNCLNQIS